MNHNPRYPIKHLSIRVPWHDMAWNGTICQNPKANGACLALKNCALNRDDDKEQTQAGRSLIELDDKDFPVCIGERASFMAPFSFTKILEHPYIAIYPTSHGNLKRTPLRYPAFSANSVP